MVHAQAPVVITGATGFIGRRLQRALLNEGHAVRALIRPESKSGQRLHSACDVFPVDLSDTGRLARAVTDARAVIYCAGSVRGRTAADFAAANVTGVRSMVAALLRSDQPCPIVLVSSLAASRPELSHYSRSKYHGEQCLLESTRLSWTILRPPAVYGPGDREMRRLWVLAKRGISLRFGSGAQRFSLLHVDDLASAIIAWLRSWTRCQQRIYSIDDGRSGGYDAEAIAAAAGARRIFTVRVPRRLLQGIASVNAVISAILGYAPMLTPGKVRELTQPDWLCDNSAFRLATGWEPSIGLSDGLRQLFDSGN